MTIVANIHAEPGEEIVGVERISKAGDPDATEKGLHSAVYVRAADGAVERFVLHGVARVA